MSTNNFTNSSKASRASGIGARRTPGSGRTVTVTKNLTIIRASRPIAMASPRNNNLLPQVVSEATRSTATRRTPPPALVAPVVAVPEFENTTAMHKWFDAFEMDAAEWRRQHGVQTSQHSGTGAGFGETAAIQQHDMHSLSGGLAERVIPATIGASTEVFTQTSTEETAPVEDRLPTPVTVTGYNVDNTASRIRWMEDRRGEEARRAAEMRAELGRKRKEAAERCRVQLEEAESRRQEREAFELAQQARRAADFEAQRPRIDKMLDEAIVEAESKARELRRNREREQMIARAAAKTQAVVQQAFENAKRAVEAKQQAKKAAELAARVESWYSEHPDWWRPDKSPYVAPMLPEVFLRRVGAIQAAEKLEREREAAKGKAFRLARPRKPTIRERLDKFKAYLETSRAAVSQPAPSSPPAKVESTPLPQYPAQRKWCTRATPVRELLQRRAEMAISDNDSLCPEEGRPTPPVTVPESLTQYPGQRQWCTRAKPRRTMAERIAQMKLNQRNGIIAFRSEPTLPPSETAIDAVDAMEETGDAIVEEMSDVIDDTRHFAVWEQRFEHAAALRQVREDQSESAPKCEWSEEGGGVVGMVRRWARRAWVWVVERVWG